MFSQERYEFRVVSCPELSCRYAVTHRALSECDVDPLCPKCQGHRLSEFIDADHRVLAVADEGERLHGVA